MQFLLDVQEDTGAEVYLEPGEAVALDAGILVGTILDAHWNGMPVAITDISATCHMPDVLEMPYRPRIVGAGEPGERSLLTLMVYLNEDFEGGETAFLELDQVIVPRRGMALLFQHMVLHEGREVRAGTKYVLRTDVFYREG